MTTKAAAALYEAEHVYRYEGIPLAVFNPQRKLVASLPVIYGFNNGGESGGMDAVLVAEDGTLLGGHLCSSEAYMPADLGCLEGTRADRHQAFGEHYPDGYRMEFVSSEMMDKHTAFNEAIERAKAKLDASLGKVA